MFDRTKIKVFAISTGCQFCRENGIVAPTTKSFTEQLMFGIQETVGKISSELATDDEIKAYLKEIREASIQAEDIIRENGDEDDFLEYITEITDLIVDKYEVLVEKHNLKVPEESSKTGKAKSLHYIVIKYQVGYNTAYPEYPNTYRYEFHATGIDDVTSSNCDRYFLETLIGRNGEFVVEPDVITRYTDFILNTVATNHALKLSLVFIEEWAEFRRQLTEPGDETRALVNPITKEVQLVIPPPLSTEKSENTAMFSENQVDEVKEKSVKKGFWDTLRDIF